MAKTNHRTQDTTAAKRDEEKFRRTKFPISDVTAWCVECNNFEVTQKGCIQCDQCIADYGRRIRHTDDPDHEFMEGEFDLDVETVNSPSFSDPDLV